MGIPEHSTDPELNSTSLEPVSMHPISPGPVIDATGVTFVELGLAELQQMLQANPHLSFVPCVYNSTHKALQPLPC